MNLLGHKIELFVKDLEVSTHFYRSVLQFEAGETRQTVIDGKAHNHTPLWKGNLVLALGLLETLPKEHHLRRAGLDAAFGVSLELCLYVADSELSEIYEHVRGAAKTRVGELRMRPWGLRDFRVVDPDGYYIRITPPDRDIQMV